MPFLRVLALLLLLAPLRAPALSCDGLGAPPATLVRDMRTSAAGGESLSQLVHSPVLGLFAWTATGMHGAEGQELWVAPAARFDVETGTAGCECQIPANAVQSGLECNSHCSTGKDIRQIAIKPGLDGAGIEQLLVGPGGNFVFIARILSSVPRSWRSDGTPEGTVPLYNTGEQTIGQYASSLAFIPYGAIIGHDTEHGPSPGVVLQRGSTPGFGYELFGTVGLNGTAGLEMVLDLANPGDSYPFDMTPYPIDTGGPDAPPGTVCHPVTRACGVYDAVNVTSAPVFVGFVATTSPEGRQFRIINLGNRSEIYNTDTIPGTGLSTTSGVGSTIVTTQAIIRPAFTPGTGIELATYFSNGTVVVSDENPGSGATIDAVSGTAACAGTFFFSRSSATGNGLGAKAPGQVGSRTLWESAGEHVYVAGCGGAAGDRVYFLFSDAAAGRELRWISANVSSLGSDPGARPNVTLVDLNPGADDSIPTSLPVRFVWPPGSERGFVAAISATAGFEVMFVNEDGTFGVLHDAHHGSAYGMYYEVPLISTATVINSNEDAMLVGAAASAAQYPPAALAAARSRPIIGYFATSSAYGVEFFVSDGTRVALAGEMACGTARHVAVTSGKLPMVTIPYAGGAIVYGGYSDTSGGAQIHMLTGEPGAEPRQIATIGPAGTWAVPMANDIVFAPWNDTAFIAAVQVPFSGSHGRNLIMVDIESGAYTEFDILYPGRGGNYPHDATVCNGFVTYTCDHDVGPSSGGLCTIRPDWDNGGAPVQEKIAVTHNGLTSTSPCSWLTCVPGAGVIFQKIINGLGYEIFMLANGTQAGLRMLAETYVGGTSSGSLASNPVAIDDRATGGGVRAVLADHIFPAYGSELGVTTSDMGTVALVYDISAGTASNSLYHLTFNPVDRRVYFSRSNYELWSSDGVEGSTDTSLIDLYPGSNENVLAIDFAGGLIFVRTADPANADNVDLWAIPPGPLSPVLIMKGCNDVDTPIKTHSGAAVLFCNVAPDGALGMYRYRLGQPAAVRASEDVYYKVYAATELRGALVFRAMHPSVGGELFRLPARSLGDSCAGLAAEPATRGIDPVIATGTARCFQDGEPWTSPAAVDAIRGASAQALTFAVRFRVHSGLSGMEATVFRLDLQRDGASSTDTIALVIQAVMGPDPAADPIPTSLAVIFPTAADGAHRVSFDGPTQLVPGKWHTAVVVLGTSHGGAVVELSLDGVQMTTSHSPGSIPAYAPGRPEQISPRKLELGFGLRGLVSFLRIFADVGVRREWYFHSPELASAAALVDVNLNATHAANAKDAAPWMATAGEARGIMMALSTAQQQPL